MTTTSLTITEANIGEMIGPPDGFLVNLTMTTGPVHETGSLGRRQTEVVLRLFRPSRLPRSARPRLRRRCDQTATLLHGGAATAGCSSTAANPMRARSWSSPCRRAANGRLR